MLVCLPTIMDLCLRVVKLGFRAFGLNIRGSLSVCGDKCGGLLYKIIYRLDVIFLGSKVLGDGPSD